MGRHLIAWHLETQVKDLFTDKAFFATLPVKYAQIYDALGDVNLVEWENWTSAMVIRVIDILKVNGVREILEEEELIDSNEELTCTFGMLDRDVLYEVLKTDEAHANDHVRAFVECVAL